MRRENFLEGIWLGGREEKNITLFCLDLPKCFLLKMERKLKENSVICLIDKDTLNCFFFCFPGTRCLFLFLFLCSFDFQGVGFLD